MSRAVPSVTAFSVIPMIGTLPPIPETPRKDTTKTDRQCARKHERRCENCGRLFKASHRNTRFCSITCNRHHLKAHDPRRRPCYRCRKDYTPKKGTKHPKYCGVKCRFAAMREADPRVCRNDQCGRTFYLKAMQSRNVTYCSPACARIGRAKARASYVAHIPKRQQGNDLTGPGLLDYAPDGIAIDRWFRRLSDTQLRSVWVAAIVEQFGEGRRAELAEALRYVRQRLQPAATKPVKIIEDDPVYARIKAEIRNRDAA